MNKNGIVLWEPMKELRNSLESLFSDFFDGNLTVNRDYQKFYPTMDIYETPDNLIVKLELPGIDKKDVKVTLTQNTLKIEGEKKFKDEVKEDNYYRLESRYGSFTRTINIPQNILADKIKAEYKDGILEILLPKAEEEKPKEVKIK